MCGNVPENANSLATSPVKIPPVPDDYESLNDAVDMPHILTCAQDWK
jgi:hypothetical protein